MRTRHLNPKQSIRFDKRGKERERAYVGVQPCVGPHTLFHKWALRSPARLRWMKRYGLEIRGIWYNYVKPLTRDLFDYLESEIDYSRSSLNFRVSWKRAFPTVSFVDVDSVRGRIDNLNIFYVSIQSWKNLQTLKIITNKKKIIFF